ncbi:hypothetical protein BGP78_10360 [Pseudoalteromonas sp. MSK9-3]|uniref:hypothetical protein n=1 Tax=Pseudoalteromonas sp. MSK9-3 TaxID=1897633 RepID=UPI000E6C9BB4|nr:hypothetical protein [Pseudoalteromonas sp. MSK9-3]RJE76805.1 hypothetical protein BGP78_10360 [Pseudoalteromonas sp. MSK9-3]
MSEQYNEENSVAAGPVKLTGKWTIGLACVVIIPSLMIYALAGEKVGKEVARWKNPEIYEQLDTYMIQYTSVIEIIEAWNNVESLENFKDNRVMLIRSGIDDAIARYSTLPIDKLGKGNEAVRDLNLAKLHMIRYDFTPNKEDFYESRKRVGSALAIVSDSSLLNDKEIEQFKKRPIIDELEWVKLALYSLHVFNGHGTYKDDLMKIKNKMGGCEYFRHTMLRHIKMNKALGCSE